ncbi:MAG: C-terminal binding protein [Dethiobacter sp.]|jgi:D-3-phosphoglycerate dehydrogenase|nr:C-terminal binding protein [Dethiobacter sp.]
MLAVIVDSHIVPGYNYEIERDVLSKEGIELRTETCRTPGEIIERCQDADALLSIYAPTPKSVIDSLPNCKVYVRYGIGYDNIDVDAATAKGIPVCNIPDYCLPEVASHTIALLLNYERKINFMNNAVKQRVWNSSLGFPSRRLSEVTLGLIGFGKIAQHVYEYAKGFGMKIIIFDPYLPDSVLEGKTAGKVTLDELYQQADYISVHVPLSAESRHLLNYDAFSRMKDSAVIINTSRGSLVDEAALIRALKEKKIRGACLDVLEHEPVLPDNELLDMDEVIITPHSAFNSVQARLSLRTRVAQTAAAVLKGEKPYNIVNKKALGL